MHLIFIFLLLSISAAHSEKNISETVAPETVAADDTTAETPAPETVSPEPPATDDTAAVADTAEPVTGPETMSPEEVAAADDNYIRTELGVNDITAPAISKILGELTIFRPVSMQKIAQNNREAAYSNRMQTAIHFGTLVADGFLLTVNEKGTDLQDIGRALIRQARALGVGERLTKRSKSLLDLALAKDWDGMRHELIRSQEDVEHTMLDLRDEEMAHVVSLGGWLRGFQLAADSCSSQYSPENAQTLANMEIMDYFLDRLDTLHPRLKATDYVKDLTEKIRAIRSLAAQAPEGVLDHNAIRALSRAADQAVAVALAPVNHEGRFLPKK